MVTYFRDITLQKFKKQDIRPLLIPSIEGIFFALTEIKINQK